MKKLFSLLSLSLLLSCSSDKEPGTAVIAVKNTLDIERIDELVTINREQLTEHLGTISDGQSVIVSVNETIVPSQMDDLDKDGQWDELAFVYNFSPNQEIEFSVKAGSAADVPQFKKRTNIHFAKVIVRREQYEPITTAVRIKGTDTNETQKHFQYEGPGWENDKVGFRNYFDERNGMDIWGKVTTEMVLDQVGIKDNYHEMQSWGMDILKVANSLGAGALAVQYNDSLYRVTAPEGATYSLVQEGPVRSVFNLDFEKIDINGNVISLRHQISIVAGEYGYRSRVVVGNAPSRLKVTTGIVNLQSKEMYTVETEGAKVVYSHDLQSYNNEYLGMAVITSDNYFEKAFATPETGDGITETFAVSMNPGNDNAVDFRFYACWEKSNPSFADKNYLEKFLVNEAREYANPVDVNFK